MASDDIIWHCLKYGFCSFKVLLDTHQMCRNKHNATGLCNRKSCPMANAQYATVKNHDGVLYLYKKTIERQHLPRKWWEKVKLPENYEEALKKIDEELMYWEVYHILKCKQRLTRLKQYLLRLKKLEKKPKVKLYSFPRKVTKRERTRERKALNAAKLTDSIKAELLDRLKSGTYGDIYNFPEVEFEAIAEQAKAVGEPEKQFVEAYDDDIMSENEIEDVVEYEMETEGGTQGDLSKEEVANYVASLGLRSSPVSEKPRRKRKHIQLGAEETKDDEL